ncbi:acetolactate synthase [Streptomonospora nanhaiensis]|uniref:Acetolactate synthase-1/2/3 large subunit n=1 Tax=Streptomonospora nanhaiensis TaxID=1323731 RepID=A0A853BRD7_9ACTN|nr:acetolactate synthase [Streptomonospora nanhaiensis]MBV2362693.1 acetolactate synthase [Streptomonospora nanhaiensis]MBX9389151.1 acetolactate synthase [Streptomonospora nanhaiensis]NYI97958.1 acetolactate synthase-1/2/3 large subunit [Streptomonospora nanhaiensis]
MPTPPPSPPTPFHGRLSGHGGTHAVEVARHHGIDTMFTLSGGHVFPLYDGAVKPEPTMRLLDVRHEQTAVFAAEAVGKLTRRAGLAVVTAGPGVTNVVSGVATAHFNGSPLVVVGGRAPDGRWGQGLLQELDQPPLLETITKRAWTVHATDGIGAAVDEAAMLANTAHRGPVFLDIPMDRLYDQAETDLAGAPAPADRTPDPEAVAEVARLLSEAERPVLVYGSDVWLDGAERAALEAAEELGVPVVTNGQGRGVLPGGHPLLASRARGAALGRADLVVVVGTPLDFRLGHGLFGGRDGAPPAKVVHVADSPAQLTRHMTPVAAVSGDLSAALRGIAEAAKPTAAAARWRAEIAEAAAAAVAADAEALASDADPIHPARVYGELNRLLDDDAVVIGDGGDFVSYAGKYIEPKHPGQWLDPGPFGCLGTGMGYSIAARLSRPSSQVVTLLGDGAAGFSLMDVDTLVRHRLPVVMVCGNNGIWGLEKAPMQMIYGYDVIAELTPQTRYDEVVRALGGGGELVTDPAEIGPALRRAFDSGVPYLVNIATDPGNVYPRKTMGV